MAASGALPVPAGQGAPPGGQAPGGTRLWEPSSLAPEEIKWFGDLLPLQRSANPPKHPTPGWETRILLSVVAEHQGEHARFMLWGPQLGPHERATHLLSSTHLLAAPPRDATQQSQTRPLVKVRSCCASTTIPPPFIPQSVLG